MKKILLIEDDPSMVHVLTIMLSEFFEVHHTLDEDDIRELAPQVDLVVSDFHFGIPGFDFYEVQNLCASLGKPLILQSGGLTEQIHSHQLHKPYGSEDLIKMIGSLITIPPNLT